MRVRSPFTQGQPGLTIAPQEGRKNGVARGRAALTRIKEGKREHGDILHHDPLMCHIHAHPGYAHHVLTTLESSEFIVMFKKKTYKY